VSEPVRLNIGCGGKRIPGYIGVDIDPKADIVSDIKTLPFDTGSVDEAMSIHALEHLHILDAHKTLVEWCRVLKPGGKLAVEVPCLDKIIHLFLSGADAQMTVVGLYGDIEKSYTNEYMMHKWCYSQAHLCSLFKAAGFEDVKVEEPLFHYKKRDMRVTGVKPNE
jgi:predicted SAM-dependent methyltransferase